MSPKQIIMAKVMESYGGKLVRSITGDGFHSYWELTYPESEQKIRSFNGIDELFDFWTNDPKVLDRLLTNMKGAKDAS